MIDNSEKKLYEKIDLCRDKCKVKNFRKEDMKLIGMLALSKDAIEIFGSQEKSFDKLIEIVDKHDNASNVIDEFLTLLGID